MWLAALAVLITRATDVLSELDGDAGHAAGPALNEDCLAGLEVKGVLDRDQRGKAGNRQSSGLDVAKARGLPGQKESYSANQNSQMRFHTARVINGRDVSNAHTRRLEFRVALHQLLFWLSARCKRTLIDHRPRPLPTGFDD